MLSAGEGLHAPACIQAYDAGRLTIEAVMAAIGLSIDKDRERDKHRAEIQLAGHLLGPERDRIVKAFDQLRVIGHETQYAAHLPKRSAGELRAADRFRRALSDAVTGRVLGWPTGWPPGD